MNKISCISYFNPCSSQFHSIKNFKKLNLSQKIATVILTAFASLFSVGILSVYTFRSLVGRMGSKVQSPTTDKTHDIAKTKLKNSENTNTVNPKLPTNPVANVQIQLPSTLLAKKTDEATTLEKFDIKPMPVEEMRANLKLVNEEYQKISEELKKRGWLSKGRSLTVYRDDIDSLADPFMPKPQDTEDNFYANDELSKWSSVVKNFEHIFDHFCEAATYLEIKENDPINKQFLEIRNLMKPILMNLIPVLYSLDGYSNSDITALELIGKRRGNHNRDIEVVGNDEKLADALIVHLIEKILETEPTESSNRKLDALITRLSDRAVIKTYALKIFNIYVTKGDLTTALEIHHVFKLSKKHLAALSHLLIDQVNKHLESSIKAKEDADPAVAYEDQLIVEEDQVNNREHSIPNLDQSIEFLKNIADVTLSKEYGLKLFNKQVAEKNLDAALQVHRQLDLPKEHLASLDTLRVESIKQYIADYTQANFMENEYCRSQTFEHVKQLGDKKLAKEYGLKLFEISLNSGDTYAVEALHRHLLETVRSPKYQAALDQTLVNHIEKYFANNEQANLRFEETVCRFIRMIENKTNKEQIGVKVFEKFLADNKLELAFDLHRNLGLKVQLLTPLLESDTLSTEVRQQLIQAIENSHQQSYSRDQFIIKLAHDYLSQNDKDSALNRVKNIYTPSDALSDLMKKLFNAYIEEKNLEKASECIGRIPESAYVESIEKLIKACISLEKLDVASKCLDRTSGAEVEKFQFQLAEAYLAVNNNEAAMNRMKKITSKENENAKKELFKKIALALKAEGKITIVQKAAYSNYFITDKQILEELGIVYNPRVGWY